MRIIDKNTDFYDYYQDILKDDTFVFDRRGSYILTKEAIADSFQYQMYDYNFNETDIRYLLLQVGSTFWLFKLNLIKGKPPVCINERYVDYTIELITKWKNYNTRCLFALHGVDFRFRLINKKFNFKNQKDIDKLIHAIDTNDVTYCKIFNNNCHSIDNYLKENKFPILRETGLTSVVDSQDIYLAFEEYFSAEKTASERTESIGLTDKDKITNHGFDLKTSFRGKVN